MGHKVGKTRAVGTFPILCMFTDKLRSCLALLFFGMKFQGYGFSCSLQELFVVRGVW